MKSHYCGEITSSNLKEEITICGWIHRRRDHGGVIFLDVRDIKGICQAVVNPVSYTHLTLPTKAEV